MTQEEKPQFFGLYHGQRVMKIDDSPSVYTVDMIKHPMGNHAYLSLKPLSSITDEHALQLGYTQTPASFWGEPMDQTPSMCFCAELSCDGIDFEHPNCMEFPMIDKLRAMGYAVGWKEYSVQDLIKEGLIKLQE